MFCKNKNLMTSVFLCDIIAVKAGYTGKEDKKLPPKRYIKYHFGGFVKTLRKARNRFFDYNTFACFT